MRTYFLIWILFTAGVSSCNKDDSKNGNVEIYLLKSYDKVAGKCQVNAATAVLKDTAIVSNDEILLYSKTAYQFKVSAAAMRKIAPSADFAAFAVTVNKQVIYYGFFKPFYSSSTCFNSITMNVDSVYDYKINVELGYPSSTQANGINDQRNNATLLAALKAQGKLK